MTQPKRKLIEVALPLEAINREAAREKSIRHGHPSTLHLWWARRPLAAARAVLFASLVDDPSARPEEFPTDEAQEAERKRLFDLIERLVKWENSNNPQVLSEARAEIMRSTGGNPPPVLDPFAGGGTIPLEAQRLGLEAHASDLNPVAVLINKALIEIPPKFAGQAPVNPEYRKKAQPSDRWEGAKGLAEDVRYYGKWMRDEAERRIGHLYPKAKLPGGGEATVIAWLWARTVRCPNPACGCQMPLVRSWVLSSKAGKEHYVEPVVNRDTQPPTVSFVVKQGKPEAKEGTVGRNGAKCISCGTAVPLEYIRTEGRAGRLSAQMMAIVAEGGKGRVFLPPTTEQIAAASVDDVENVPDTDLPVQALGFRTQAYGMTKHRHLFSNRQLLGLVTLLELIPEVKRKIKEDVNKDWGQNSGFKKFNYADSLSIYLAFALDRAAESGCTLARWQGTGDFVAGAFSRQALSMMWDYAEVNFFSNSTRNFMDAVNWVAEAVEILPATGSGLGRQADAAAPIAHTRKLMISTDPPYYDNVPYADLSDFFYVWLRQVAVHVYPEIFSTLLVPKSNELVAEPFRHGGREAARVFFEEGLGRAFQRIYEATDPEYPLTVYYAFKQTESDDADDDATEGDDSAIISTGWETMLEGLLQAGFQIKGTWPVRTERAARTRGLGSNALASSIVLVCRPRPANAPIATRREFLAALRSELPVALRELQQGNIAPVDLAQAAIGPGMAVYSRYSQVMESDGSPMRVRTALALINQILDEVLAEQEGDFDADTRWALAWFEQVGFAEGEYGLAETLSKAKNTSVEGMVRAGIVAARSGKVRLLRPEELPEGWNPASDNDIPVWEATHHLIRVLNSGGEAEAAELLSRLGGLGDVARELAYRLYSICERKKWTQEALMYNGLVTSWLEVGKLSQKSQGPVQESMF
ncbi:hypothetical protein Mterra_00059 [Calidithermus terrae]|uniref:DUF1156 domain-containing protein n=1 Tax=Calidithermus terrae TaxID=1408545 RepID=A0A399F6S1_9DEIN|nr:DUF1156 domain-containing protein [Calidithermus terrae]RIH90979.1 hypothetical protein Mterra_00059 [Calidithermus terrae]